MTDNVAGRDGSDTLSNIEVLHFTDQDQQIGNLPPTVAAKTSLGSDIDAVNLSLASLFTDSDALTYQITSGALPAGLGLDANTGAITGQVAAGSVTGPVTLGIRATDTATQTVDSTLKLYLSDMQALQVANKTRVGSTLTLDLLVDPAFDPASTNNPADDTNASGTGVKALDLRLGYDASLLHFTGASGITGSTANAGSATESGSTGSVAINWSDANPVIGNSKVMTVSFSVLQEGDFKLAVSPNSYDGLDLSSKSTYALMATA